MKTLLCKIFFILLLSNTLLISKEIPYSGVNVNNFTDLIGTPTKPTTAEQSTFINSLNTNALLQNNAEVVDQVPIAMRTFMTRLNTSIPWAEFFYGLDLKFKPVTHCGNSLGAFVSAASALLGTTSASSGIADTIKNIIGFETGLIEPVLMTEWVKLKFNLKALGTKIAYNKMVLLQAGKTDHQDDNGEGNPGGSWSYQHTYTFPVFSLIFKKVIQSSHEILCLEKSEFTVMYFSEFDPSAHDMFMQAYLNPELWISLIPFAVVPMALASCISVELFEWFQEEHRKSIADYENNRAIIDIIYPMNGCIGVKAPITFTQSESALENSINVNYNVLWMYGKGGAVKQTVKSSLNDNNKQILCAPQKSNFGFIHTQFMNQQVTPRVSGIHEFGVASIPHYALQEDGSSGEDIVNLIWMRRHYAAGPYSCIKTFL